MFRNPSKPPVSRRLRSSLARFFVAGTPSLASLRTCRITGSEATSAGPERSAELPREVIAPMPALENGIDARFRRVSDGAASPSRLNTGVAASEKRDSSIIVERSSRRNPGSLAKPASRSARREAVAAPTTSEELMKPATLSRSRARAVITCSPSVARSARLRFWSRRIASTRLVSRRAGLARSTISASSSPRAANPAPRSLRMSRKRSGYGSSMMLLTRSRSIALPLRSSGSRY